MELYCEKSTSCNVTLSLLYVILHRCFCVWYYIAAFVCDATSSLLYVVWHHRFCMQYYAISFVSGTVLPQRFCKWYSYSYISSLQRVKQLQFKHLLYVILCHRFLKLHHHFFWQQNGGGLSCSHIYNSFLNPFTAFWIGPTLMIKCALELTWK